jgi:hypothetical protein
MTPRQCPFCELRFAHGAELEAHLTDEHPDRIHLGFPSTVHALAHDEREPEPGHEPRTDPAQHPVPRTWEDARRMTADFEGLLRKYHGDYQQAIDAQRRGEHGDAHDGGMSNPM